MFVKFQNLFSKSNPVRTVVSLLVFKAFKPKNYCKSSTPYISRSPHIILCLISEDSHAEYNNNQQITSKKLQTISIVETNITQTLTK